MRRFLVLLCLGWGWMSFTSSGQDSLIAKIETTPDDTNKVILLRKIAVNLYRTNADSALYFLNRGMRLSDEISYSAGKVRIQNMIGNVLNHKGKVDSAMEIYLLNLQLCTDIGHNSGRIAAYNNIGLLYRQTGNNQKAMEFFLKGIKESEAMPKSFYLTNLYTNLGLVYYDLKDYEKALDYYFKALDKGKKDKAYDAQPYIYNAIGRIFTNRSLFDSALHYYDLGVVAAEENRNLSAETFISRGIGDLYLRKSEYDNAFIYLSRSLKLAEKIQSKNELSKTYLSLAAYYQYQNDLSKSNELALKAYSRGQELNSLDITNVAATYLYENYEKMAVFDSALKYHKISRTITDSLLNEENVKSMMQLSMQFDYEKEEREKELIQQAELKRHKLIRDFLLVGLILTFLLALVTYRYYRIKKRKNAALLELNRTKDKFFSIISHDLKGPFNSLVGFSSVLLRKYSDTLEPKVEKYVSIIHQSSKILFELVENLLQWAKLKEKKIELHPEEIDIKDNVEKTLDVLNLNAIKKGIKLINQVEDSTILYTDPNLFSFIIRNLVSNAIKFSNQNGEIYIKGYMQNSNAVFIVQDQGIGMNEDEVNKLFREDVHHTTKGTDGEQGSGLGLILCKEFIEKLNGTIRVESSPGEGSSFVIELKYCTLH